MSDRIRNWWNTGYDRVNDYVPWHRRRPRVRPNARHWPSYYCKFA